MVIWNRRSCFASEPNLLKEYGTFENLCSLRIHHSGVFSKNRGVAYVNGTVDFYDFVDMDVFSIHELADMVSELDNQHNESIYFHFHIRGIQLDIGLMPLLTDGDVHMMTEYNIDNQHLDFGDIDCDDDESQDGIVGGNDLLYDKNNILDEAEVDMTNFISVLDHEVERDPNTIPIPDSFETRIIADNTKIFFRNLCVTIDSDLPQEHSIVGDDEDEVDQVRRKE
ncbi:hypothetical protein LXL04_015171 [Taraxacum kok-saghyz]